MTNFGLVPLLNFAKVSDKVYRCAQPDYDYQYNWIKEKLGADILVNLRSESDLDSRLGIPHGFEVFDVRVPDHHAPTVEQYEEFVKFFKENEDKIIVIHCAHGQGRTTTFCVIVRLIQGWSLVEALREQTEKYLYSFKHPEQLDFLTKIKR